MSDLIDRQQAIDIIEGFPHGDVWNVESMEEMVYRIELLTSAQPEVKQISYTDCANAMLMMWMDKVLTDGEYNRIMDKLNEHEKKKGKDNG